MSSPSSFVLPDLHAVTPYKGSFNPHYPEAAAESSEWVNSYKVLSDKKRAFFLQGGSELLCAHAYPYAGYQQFRTTCDFVNLLFTVDEISDDQNGKGAYETGLTFYNAMSDPAYDDGTVLCKMTKEYVDHRRLRREAPSLTPRSFSSLQVYRAPPPALRPSDIPPVHQALQGLHRGRRGRGRPPRARRSARPRGVPDASPREQRRALLLRPCRLRPRHRPPRRDCRAPHFHGYAPLHRRHGLLVERECRLSPNAFDLPC